MDFRFRSQEDDPSSSSSLTSTYFTEQALRMGYFNNGIRRTDFVRNLDLMREAIEIELEKERIREEIIASEIIRKRALEAELRREMAIGRDLAIRRAAEFRAPLLRHHHHHHHHHPHYNHHPNDSRVLFQRQNH